MSRDDSDIIAVRDLPPGLPEPTDESVSRTWQRISAARRPARARTPSRVLVPAMAAILVAGLVLGGALVFRPAELPWGAAPSAEKSADPNLTPTPPETVAALNALADAAARGPAAAEVRSGQLIFVRHDGWAATFLVGVNGGANSAPTDGREGEVKRQVREIWFDPQGMIALSITDGREAMVADPVAGREALKRDGPGLAWPTPQWLASLPTDPERLRAVLRQPFGEGGAWSTDHALWTALQEFYLGAGPLLTPELRAALLRSFTGLRGLTSSEVTVDGRRLVAVRHSERELGDEILFDPSTGVAVGRRTVSLDPGVTVVTGPGVPKLDPGVTYQATWTQKVVDAVGDR